jgi:hypothetical protein
MFREGIGETGRFILMHPVVTASYYAIVIGILMFSNSPLFLISAIAMGMCYDMILKGRRSLRNNLFIILFMSFLTVLINALFTHNGSTVLFYLGNNRVTLEAACYGLAMALMLSGVVIWFSSFNVVMTSEKLIYIFGRFAPVLGLTLSMIFRFVPLLRTRFELIGEGQKALYAGDEKGFIGKIRQFGKEVSILVSWSLESSIESADSMAARGYGLKGRTSYNLFKIRAADIMTLLLSMLLGGVTITSYAAGVNKLYYYPVIRVVESSPKWLELAGYVSFIALLAMPLAIDLIGELRWKKSRSTI